MRGVNLICIVTGPSLLKHTMHMRHQSYPFRFLCTSALFAATAANAAIEVIPPSATFAIASDLGNLSVFSPSTAVVGRLGAVLIDGFVEFDLAHAPESGS